MADNDNPGWEELLRGLLGSAADDLIAALRAHGIDPDDIDSSVLPTNPLQMQAMMQQMQTLMNASDGPVNWPIAREFTLHQLQLERDRAVSHDVGQSQRQSLQVADLWLDPVTEFTPGQSTRQAWSRRDWVEHTLESWKTLVEPVARNASRALSDAMGEQLGMLEGTDAPDFGEAAGMFGSAAGIVGAVGPMMEKMAATIFGHQVGQILFQMSSKALSSTDGGVALGENGTTALVATNVEDFCRDIDLPHDEVVHFLALRECAHARLFASVPWLRDALVTAVASYGEHIHIDTDAMREVASEIDMSDPQSLDAATLSAVFTPSPNEEQTRALARLETLLALIEGWVEVVTASAGRPFLPHLDALVETMRRRRLDGGPTEQMLARLIGLNTRPQHARAAGQLWQAITDREGIAGRDSLWHHPDMVPSLADLQDPEGYYQRKAEAADADADIDAALEQLIDGTLGWAEGLTPEQDSEGDAKRRESGGDGDADNGGGDQGDGGVTDEDGPGAGSDPDPGR